ncbi:response regulator [Zobellella aerophila]|uniref:Response regulator n=1 Tax=Zobellella aerophila TaxID=870480 RepID=A0ABP6V3Q5_9GAMM
MFDSAPLILLIEDDPVFRRLMVAYLELWGARVMEAEDGAEGLNMVARQRPDLVLSDLLIPELDGHEIVASLKQQYPDLPVIVISGQQKMADVARVLRSGAEDYLIKPIRNWSMVAEVIAASLRPEQGRLIAEFSDHLAYYRRQDIAASRLLLSLQPNQNFQMGPWRLNCQQSSPWVLTECVVLNNNLLLLLAEFDPLNMDTPVVMTLVTFLLNGPLRQYQRGEHRLLDSPAQTLEYINCLILDAGLDTRVNLVLIKLDADKGIANIANGGMQGTDWLEACNAGPLGCPRLVASQSNRPFALPWKLTMTGGFGSEIQLTASHQSLPYANAG